MNTANRMTIAELLDARVGAALREVTGAETPAVLQPASRLEFGDYQANGVMAAAKAAKTNPRALAERVIAALDLSGIAAKVEPAGPGFINITLDSAFLAARLKQARAASDLGVPKPPPQRIVLDYSAPNLAKEMHVGHLRSTIIGDAIARVLMFLGHHVIRQNHVGDWGTQFGMLTAYLAEQGAGTDASLALSDLEDFYRRAKAQYDADAAFAERARGCVVRLQSGDPAVNTTWRRFVEISLAHCEAVYNKLGVLLTREDLDGESSYEHELEGVVADLRARGLAVESEGAQVVFLDETGRDGERQAFIVQKQDGGYLYATTDIAAIRRRVGPFKADRVIYVVDARQSLHFQQLFAVCRRAGYVPEQVQLEHVGFGVMLGPDGKPFKTRLGGAVKLIELLQEAEERAYALVTGKNAALAEAARRKIAHAVGIGAVKYADLSKNRTSDYVFDWDTMLSFDGNTAPYLQYAGTRIAGVFRKAPAWDEGASILLPEPAERALALQLTRFGDALHTVAREATPHVLCAYLYELAAQFTRFYESCPVLKSDESLRASRLSLCAMTADTLRTGLNLLGIETLEEM
jgi:arginyl-tRNA synthetase